MIEVENVETALGIADAITTRSILERGHAPHLYGAPLDPPLYDHFAIVHRRNASLSPPIRAVIEIATAVLRSSVGDEGG